MPSKSALWQNFNDWLKEHPDDMDQYKKLRSPGKTMALKSAFRMKWAASRLDESTVVRERMQLESYSIVNTEDGTYEPFGRILKFEGGTEFTSSWKAAYNYISACIKLRGYWLAYNSFTGRADFIYIKKGRRSVVEQK